MKPVLLPLTFSLRHVQWCLQESLKMLLSFISIDFNVLGFVALPFCLFLLLFVWFGLVLGGYFWGFVLGFFSVFEFGVFLDGSSLSPRLLFCFKLIFHISRIMQSLFLVLLLDDYRRILEIFSSWSLLHIR